MVKDTCKDSTYTKISELFPGIKDYIGISQWLDPSGKIFPKDTNGVDYEYIKDKDINYFGRFNEICKPSFEYAGDDNKKFFETGVSCVLDYDETDVVSLKITNFSGISEVKITFPTKTVETKIGSTRKTETGPIAYNSNNDTVILISALNKITNGRDVKLLKYKPSSVTDFGKFVDDSGTEITVDNFLDEYGIDVYEIQNIEEHIPELKDAITYGIMTLDNNGHPTLSYLQTEKTIASDIIYQILKTKYGTEEEIPITWRDKIIRFLGGRIRTRSGAILGRTSDETLRDFIKIIYLLKHTGDGGSASMADDLNKEKKVIFVTGDRMCAAEFLRRNSIENSTGKKDSICIYDTKGECYYKPSTSSSRKRKRGGAKGVRISTLDTDKTIINEDIDYSELELDINFSPNFTIYPNKSEYHNLRKLNDNIFRPDILNFPNIKVSEIVSDDGVDVIFIRDDYKIIINHNITLLDEDDEIIHSFETIEDHNDFLKKLSIILKYVFNRITEDGEAELNTVVSNRYNNIIKIKTIEGKINNIVRKIAQFNNDINVIKENKILGYGYDNISEINKKLLLGNIEGEDIRTHLDNLIRDRNNLEEELNNLQDELNKLKGISIDDGSNSSSYVAATPSGQDSSRIPLTPFKTDGKGSATRALGSDVSRALNISAQPSGIKRKRDDALVSTSDFAASPPSPPPDDGRGK